MSKYYAVGKETPVQNIPKVLESALKLRSRRKQSSFFIQQNPSPSPRLGTHAGRPADRAMAHSADTACSMPVCLHITKAEPSLVTCIYFSHLAWQYFWVFLTHVLAF